MDNEHYQFLFYLNGIEEFLILDQGLSILLHT